MPLSTDSIGVAVQETADGTLVGRNATSKVGYCGTTPIVRTTLPIAAVDPATTMALVNAIRAYLVACGQTL